MDEGDQKIVIFVGIIVIIILGIIGEIIQKSVGDQNKFTIKKK